MEALPEEVPSVVAQEDHSVADLVGQEDLGHPSGRHMELGVGFLQRYFLPFAKGKSS